MTIALIVLLLTSPFWMPISLRFVGMLFQALGMIIECFGLILTIFSRIVTGRAKILKK